MNLIERGRTAYCSTRNPSSTTGGLELDPNVAPVCVAVRDEPRATVTP